MPVETAQIRAGEVLSRRSLVSQVMTLAWPVVVEQLLSVAVGLVNAYLVGHLGAAALAAAGLSSRLRLLLIGLFTAVGVGSTALVARHTGAGEPKQAQIVASQSLLLAVILGVLTIPPCVVWGKPLLSLLGAADDVVALGGPYMVAIGTTMPLMAILFIGNATLRGAGDTRRPMMVMALVNLVNVTVSSSLVGGVGPLPALGVLGAGIGSAVAMGVGGLAVAVILLGGHSPTGIRITPSTMRFNPQHTSRLVRIGLPSGAEQMLMRFAQLALASVVTQLGTAAYAGHQLGMQMLMIAWMPGFAFSVAASSLVGQELGRGKPQRAAACTYTAGFIALAIMCSAGVVAFLLPRPLLSTFTSDPDVIDQGLGAVRVGALMQFPLAWYFVFSGALRGAGDTRFVLVALVLSIWLIRLPLAMRLGLTFGLGVTGVWAAMSLDMTSRAILLLLRFRKGAWKRLKV